MKNIIIIIILALHGFAAKAQIPQPDPDTTTRHFLIVASIKNLQEVSAGRIAIQKANRPDIKSFAQMMVKDHGDAQRNLLQLAVSRNISLPPAASEGIQPDPGLKNAGSNFDRLYVHGMVSGHQNTVAVFQNYAVNGKDPAVKAWAQQMLPVLKQHLTEIKAIDATMN